MFSISHLNNLRSAELDRVLPYFPAGARVLEIGAGTGQQAAELARRGFDVTAVDVASSEYAGHRLFPVVDYDGRHLPFAAASFDVVFTSNALEHIRDLSGLHAEVARVLRPGGRCVHILPTHAWRFWTMATAYPALVPLVWQAIRRPSRKTAYEVVHQITDAVTFPRHGERGNAITELATFRPSWWLKNFREHGFEVDTHAPIGIFYTGYMLVGARLGVERRRALARRLGSACHLFVLRKR